MKRIKLLVSGILIIAMLLSLVSLVTCTRHDGEEQTTAGTDSRGESDRTSAGGDEETGSEDTTERPQPGEDTTRAPEDTKEPDPPVNSDAYAGIVISKVYGNGGAADAAMRYGFIELYNTTKKTMSLAGLSVYYRTDGAKEYQTFDFDNDVRMNPESSLLIRCREGGKSGQAYNTSCEVISLDAYDFVWDIKIDNKDIRLFLAPRGLHPDKETMPSAYDAAVSCFTAIVGDATPLNDVFTVDDLSKNKMAVRTSLTVHSGYHLVNLTKANSSTLRTIVPHTASGKENRVVASRLNEVVFSADAGFYTKAIQLTLSAGDGYTIYYTLDGSDPSTSSTKKTYTGAISLEDTSAMSTGSFTQWVVRQMGSGYKRGPMIGAHVVKAYATNGTDETGIYTNTYFISSDMSAFGVTVMSLSMDKTSFCGTNGFYNNYYGGANGTNTRGVGLMEVFDKNGVRHGYSNIELAISGHGSSGFHMKSMRLYYKNVNNQVYDPLKAEESGKTEKDYMVKQESGFFNDLYYDLFDGYAKNENGQAITDFSRLLLRNSGNDCGESYIRDAYMQRVCASLEVDTMAYAPVLLFINGEFWGVYNARERYSPEYAESHYGVGDDDVAVIESDYSKVHTNTNADFVLSAGVEGDQDDFNDLTQFVRTHDLSVQENYDYVAARIDLNSFIDMYVARLFFNARDWPENNIKIWRTRTADDPSGVEQKWRFTLLDMDMGISFFTDSNNTTATANFFGWCDATGCVIGTYMHQLRQNTTFKNRFVVRFYEVVTEILTSQYMERELNALVEQRSRVMELQYERWSADGANSWSYEESVWQMQKFVRERGEIALQQMYSYFGINEAYVVALMDNSVVLNCDDDRVSVRVNGESARNGEKFRFKEDSAAFTVEVSVKDGYELSEFTFTDAGGNVTKGKNGKLTFSATRSGTICVVARKKHTGEPLSVHAGIVASGYSMYFLSPEGKLYSWGYGGSGILGYTASGNVNRPQLVMEGVAKIAACHSNDCENGNSESSIAILTVYGEVYTVGRNDAGQLGRTTTPTTLAPIAFSGNVTDISMGYDHLILIDDEKTLWGTGNNRYGQLGKSGYGSSVSKFQKIATGVRTATAGRRNTVYVLENGDCYVLGDGRWNKYNDSDDAITTPYLVLKNVAYVESGEHQTVFVTADGDLYYAGWRDLASFNNGMGGGGAVYLTSGVSKATIHFDSMLILKTDGSVFGYGLNTGNAIGGTSVNLKLRAVLATGVADIASGYAFSAFLMKDGSIRTLGDCSYGQAGNGSETSNANMISITIK